MGANDDPDKWALFRTSIVMHATAYNTGVVQVRLEFNDVPQGTPEYEALMLLWRSYHQRQLERNEQQAASGTQGDFFYG